MSNSFSSFGQSHNSPSAFGQASNANTSPFRTSILPSSASFGTSNPPLFSFPPTFGISNTPIPNGTAYASTNEVESSADKLQSISAMPIYNGKSHEEIRFESLNSGEKASSRSHNIFGASPVLGQSSNSTSNISAFGSQFGGPITGQFSNVSFGPNFRSNSCPLRVEPIHDSFGGSSAPFCNSFGAFGQSTSFGQVGPSASFGSKTGAFGGSEPFFGISNLGGSYPSGGIESQTHTNRTTGFGGFSNNNKGSRIAPYRTTKEEGNTTLQSLSAMPVYSGKSHEELRLEDYNKGDRGAFSSFSFSGVYTTTQNPSTQTNCNLFSFPPTSSGLFSSQTTSNSIFPLMSSSNFSHQTSHVPFSDHLSSKSYPCQTFNNPFSPQLPSTNHNFSSPCTIWTCKPQPCIIADHNTCTDNLFSFKPFTTPLGPQTSFPPLNLQASINGISTQPSLGFGLDSTYHSVFSPQVPSTTCPPTTSSFLPFNSITGQTSPSPFAPQPTDRDSTFLPKTSNNNSFPPPTSTKNYFTPPILATTCNPTTSSFTFPAPIGQFNSPPLVAAPSASTSSANAGSQTAFLSNPLQSAPAIQMSYLQPSTEASGPNTTNQEPTSQSTVDQVPDMARLSISLPGSNISVQCGISSVPVHDKPSTHVRLTSSLTSRHLSHHTISLPVQKYDSGIEGPKVTFFNKNGESSLRESTLVPRENPRAFFGFSAELWPHRLETEKKYPETDVSLHGNGDDVSPENNNREPNNVVNINFSFFEHDDPHEPEICEQMDEIEALMPKLRLRDYYTEPSIAQLAEKEKAHPGFCSRVRNFEIGRCGYGNIKFLGVTDVRNLSLDSLVEFNNRELLVYKNEYEKPPVGEGLNKQAEVTLLNIHCVDKKTGKIYVDGPEVEKYKEILMKKGEEQGLEFISFDPAKGEWKFKVQHF